MSLGERDSERGVKSNGNVEKCKSGSGIKSEGRVDKSGMNIREEQ